MRVVPLSAVANQSFTITIGNDRWVVRIVEVVGAMVADVSRNGLEILKGSRILAGEALIPYRYLQTGNFVTLTQNDALPNWREFGISQILVYLSEIEVAAISTSQISVGEVTARAVSYLTTDEGFYITTDTGDLLTDD